MVDPHYLKLFNWSYIFSAKIKLLLSPMKFQIKIKKTSYRYKFFIKMQMTVIYLLIAFLNLYNDRWAYKFV